MRNFVFGFGFVCLCASTIGATVLVACGSEGTPQEEQGLPEGSSRTLRSQLPRDSAPQVSSDEAHALVQGNNAFAMDLYHQLGGDFGNMMLSPWSISTALAMAYAGARGTTADEMAATLHFTLPQDRLHPAFNYVDLALRERSEQADPENGKGFALNVANALWPQDGYPFEQAYLDTIAVNYGAGLYLVDFHDPEGVRKTINDWTSEQTQDRIPELIPSGALTPQCRLVLTNAIYFKAPWANEFGANATMNDTFHTLASGDVTVPMMSMLRKLRFADGDGYRIAELPYEGDQVVMTFVLPDDGQFTEVEAQVTGVWLDTALAATSYPNVAITLPKFEFRTSAALKTALTELGMPSAFGSSCNLNGIASTNELSIQDVLHQSFIAVDEKGTEAAAATAVVAGVDGGFDPNPPTPEEFRMDRPFLFFIRDVPTQTILFAGRVVNPAQK